MAAIEIFTFNRLGMRHRVDRHFPCRRTVTVLQEPNGLPRGPWNLLDGSPAPSSRGSPRSAIWLILPSFVTGGPR